MNLKWEGKLKKIYKEISDEELNAITNAINIKYGIDFTNYEKKSLKRGFARLIGKYEKKSLLELWSSIISDKDFTLKCIDDLTVNLTELFRNPQIWNDIQQSVIDRYGQNSTINIWHAGCSTGEEIYSMAIVLDNCNLLKKSNILATDLSNIALEKAKKGFYPNILHGKYLRNFTDFHPRHTFNYYFNTKEEGFSIKENFKKNITYKIHNLVTGEFKKNTFDIVFCRNVMIYFDESLKIKVLKGIYDSLKPDGLLIIGFYDVLPLDSKNFFDAIDSGSKIYGKKSGDENDTLTEIKLNSAADRLRQYVQNKQDLKKD